MIDSFRKAVITELIKLFKKKDNNFNIENEVAKIINNEPDGLYSDVIFDLIKIKIEPKEAQKCFNELIDLWRNINHKIGRDIGIKIAALDYFFNINKKLLDPQIVDTTVLNEIEENTDKDKLTGLYNFGYYKKRLKEEISISSRYNKFFSLVVIDIDDFKKYNDSFGHDEGNVVLERLAKVLTDSVRESDIVFRFGGEEFVLLLIETTKKGAYVVAERARKKISEQQFKRQVTISLGVSTFPVDAKDSEKLFELADKALYRAKADGKNRVCLYHIERRVDLRIPSQVVVSFRKIETTPPCGHPSIEGNFDRNSILEKKIKTEIATDITATHHDYNYELRDIGRHGFAFYSDEHIKISSLIKGNISLPNQGEINFSGKVVWNEELIAGKHINGVTFFEIDKKSEVALENYIQDRSNNINGIDID